ncbi:ATP-binding protein [Dactylosporangium sp. AC04546]|uniref:ATP-binding protein n=1 Tax=Dactylosporangium sp. AC04546 TaxID=2862460 RepID=UPI001EE0D37C|nr:ATP-binding protein [Dactylosporangium sp. AC04546]WVK79084.1 ATP-binding protein [Dactylosporangium sp. AC04546]
MARPERPIDPHASPVAAFASDLRELRRAAGGPSYRAMATRARYSPSVLSTATSGGGLPTLAVTLAFVEACGGDRDEWEQRWRRLAVATDGRYAGGDPVPRHVLPVPMQLPAGPARFTGRAAVLDRLTELDAPAGVTGPAPTLLHGAVGTGKSACAVRWAATHRTRYPDGVLYADLRDVDPDETGGVLAELLRSVGAPDCGSLAELGRTLRSVLAQRRLLVVLDNVCGEAQVRPLLGEAPGSRMLLTSRSRLLGLDGVERVPVGRLPPAESLALLRALLGGERVDAAPAAAAEVAELCDHLPLALRIAAARAAPPGWTLEQAAARLRDPRRRLAELRAGDTDLRARLADAAAAFTALERTRAVLCALAADRPPPTEGALPADRPSPTDGALPADRPATAGGAAPDGEAEAAMEALVDAGLAEPDGGPGRYALPSLVRLFLAEDRAAGPAPVNGAINDGALRAPP